MCECPLDRQMASQVSGWIYGSEVQGRGPGWSYKFVEFISIQMEFKAVKLDVLINRVSIQS